MSSTDKPPTRTRTATPLEWARLMVGLLQLDPSRAKRIANGLELLVYGDYRVLPPANVPLTIAGALRAGRLKPADVAGKREVR